MGIFPKLEKIVSKLFGQPRYDDVVPTYYPDGEFSLYKELPLITYTYNSRVEYAVHPSTQDKRTLFGAQLIEHHPTEKSSFHMFCDRTHRNFLLYVYGPQTRDMVLDYGGVIYSQTRFDEKFNIELLNNKKRVFYKQERLLNVKSHQKLAVQFAFDSKGK